MSKPLAGRHRVSIFGVTGRSGAEALNIVAAASGSFEIVALTSNYEVSRLANAASMCRAKMAVAADPEAYLHLKDLLASGETKPGAGDKAVLEAAAISADTVLVLLPGMAGLGIALRAVTHARTIAFADPRALLAGGRLLGDKARANGVTLRLLGGSALGLGSPAGHVADGAGAAIDELALVPPETPADALTPDALSALTAREIASWPSAESGYAFDLDDATKARALAELLALAVLAPERPKRIGLYRQAPGIVRPPPLSGVMTLADGRAFWTVLADASPDERLAAAIRMLLLPDQRSNHVSGHELSETELTSLIPLDPARYPLLSITQSVLLQPSAAAVVWQAAYDIAAAGFIDKSIGFLDIARVVTESLGAAGREGLIREPLDVAAIEATDLAARELAYGLLDEVR